MNTKCEPSELAESILTRSRCKVKVGAVLQDRFSVFGWGWNSEGPHGHGMCAEMHTISRVDWGRRRGATMWVAGKRAQNNKIVSAKPCAKCAKVLKSLGIPVMYRDEDGEWKRGT